MVILQEFPIQGIPAKVIGMLPRSANRMDTAGFRRVRAPLRPLWVLLSLLLLAAPWLSGPAHGEGRDAPDVRVLIDVSGSMRETDPGNLRVPATRLLVNLIPEHARAGVWTFGTEAAPLVPLGEVDGAWRERAMQRTARIGSSDRYTDIADGLSQVDRNWLGAEGGARVVILLTDGQVDVDEDARLDERSRMEILQRRIPAMRAQGVRLYAVGLSAAADQRMLEQLAIRTGGFAVVARDADELLAAFLEIFSAALPVNGVPVERQRFRVDPSVRELTVIAVHPHRSEPVALLPPGGVLWTADTHDRGVRWLAQDTFSMIHVPGPVAGEWALHGGGVDTRVHIHSDLRLVMTGLPAHLLAGEEFEIRAVLRDADQPLADDAFQDLLHYRLQVLPPAGAPAALEAASSSGPGVRARFRAPAEAGLYRIEAFASAGILQRTASQLVRVYDQAFVAYQETVVTGDSEQQRFRLAVRGDVIRLRDLRVRGDLRGPDGSRRAVAVSSGRESGRWEAEVPVAAGVHEFRFYLEGFNSNGRRFSTQSEALLFGAPEAPAQPAAPADPAAEPAAPQDPVAPAGGWLLVVVALLGGGGALAGWLWWRRRAAGAAGDTASTAVDDPAGQEQPDADLPPVVSLTQAPGEDRGGPEGRGTS